MRLPDDLARKNDSRILFMVLDGLGGTTDPSRGLTELQVAHTPVLDALAARSETGLIVPILPGITPGSGPGHFALFGYDPVVNNIGRGVLEAAGIDFPLQEGDIAIRVNFATVDSEGRIIDRRAGRIPTEECERLCEILSAGVSIPGVEIFIKPVKEHRAAVILRAPGEGLEEGVADTDPQVTGMIPFEPVADEPVAERVASLLREFLSQATGPLAEAGTPAYFPLLRGIAKYRLFPSMYERFGLKALAVATYPMYKGISRLLGMDVHEGAGNLGDQLEAVRSGWGDHDFFFVHYKATDSRGEDGDFDAKVAAIEDADAALADFVALQPDVAVVTGDHSTPALMGEHSWHSVPVILSSPVARHSGIDRFDEIACAQGTLGTFPAKHLMGLVLGHAGRLEKFGA
ncbi:2,3-bisphosphoglycerate-independent phosphoglycerate mutase [Candidatus Zixiibacteriota bacterium]